MKQLKQIIDNNPVFVQLLGMCPTLATTTSVKNGIGMGISAMLVLIFSNISISLLRKFVPSKIRIASYVVVIAGFVSIIDILLKAYLPELSKSLGIFIPLIVVNCIILARAEAFASKNGVFASAIDGLVMGLGFTMALIILSTFREIIGAGTFYGYSVFGAGYVPATIMLLPPGGFLTLGIVIAIFNMIRNKKKSA